MKVGTIVAKYGAWNRKYKIVSIREDAIQFPYDPPDSPRKVWIISLLFLGNFYATDPTRNRPAKNAQPREVIVHKIGDTPHLDYYLEDRKFKI